LEEGLAYRIVYAGGIIPLTMQKWSGWATPAQLKLVYLTGTRDAHLTEEELEEDCQQRYGGLPLLLTKREASEVIDSLKVGAKARAVK
jgi:hypothetical protein